MDSRGEGPATRREPINKPWVWVVLVGIILLGVPWYLPRGDIAPVIFGFPYWALISVFFSLVLCGFLSWLCLNEWEVLEHEEESERRAAGRDAGREAEGQAASGDEKLGRG